MTDPADVAAAWLGALAAGEAEALHRWSTEDVRVVLPDGTFRGRSLLAPWLARPRQVLEPLRWFVGGDGDVVVEHAARDGGTAGGTADGSPFPASRFVVVDGRVAWYQRHWGLGEALTVAGLDVADEVRSRRPVDLDAVGEAVRPRAPRIATPLGPVTFTLIAGERPLPHLPVEVRQVGSTAGVARWATVEGLTCRLVLVDLLALGGGRPSPDQEHGLAGLQVALLDLTWADGGGPLDVRVSLPPEARLHGAPGENLWAYEASAPGCHLAIGAPDEEAAIDGLVPASWLRAIGGSEGRLGLQEHSGVRWLLPPARAGDAAQLHCTVAWSATSENAPWIGVDRGLSEVWGSVAALRGSG